MARIARNDVLRCSEAALRAAYPEVRLVRGPRVWICTACIRDLIRHMEERVE